jgi:Spy/CpxP family protein refolding chaperone
LIDLESDLEKAQLEMKRQMETDGDDYNALKKHLDTVSKRRASIQEVKLKNWVDARKVLTDEQKKTVGDKQRMMRGHF